MNFKVYLIRANLSPLTGGEVRKYFREAKNMEVKSDGPLLTVTYRNPATLATCVFTYSSEGIDAGDHPGEAFKNVQLSCEIPCLRPSYFAYEAAAELERLANALMVAVLNPHSTKSPDSPAPCVAPEILSDWQRVNKADLAKTSASVPSVNPRSTSALWKYLLVKAALKAKLGEEVPVPDMPVIRVGNSPIAHTTVNWDDCAPMALPQCDRVIIHRVMRQGVFGFLRKEETGVARYLEVIEAMGPHMEQFKLNKPRYSIYVLGPTKDKAALKAFKSIPLAPLPTGLTEVPVYGIVDIPPVKKK